MVKAKLLAFLALFFPIVVNAEVICDGGVDITCTSSFPTLEEIVDCLDKYTVTSNYYDEACYLHSQPTALEIIAWNNAILNMLTVGCSSGPPVPVPGLEEYYNIARVTEPGNSGYSWCILSETKTYRENVLTHKRVYRRGWGLVVTPADPVNGVIRDLHFSVPHPISDENTPQQAAALFKRTGGKSLVVTGRRRDAYASPSTCVQIYYKTDGAHDNNEPFYLALVQVAAWKNAHGGCNWACCAYLQFHGMAKETCPDDEVFLSSGRANTLSSETCYANPLLPISRLKHELLALGVDVGTPAVAATCDLTATRNIFGRLVSGIDPSSVCASTPSIPCTTSSTCPPTTAAYMGKFIHIEQDPDQRRVPYYGIWETAIKAAFPPITACPACIMEENVFKVQS